jgi:glucokinase
VSWLEPMEPDLEDDATGSSPEGPEELRGGSPVNRAPVIRGDAVLPPDPGARRAIGIDIGGTKIAAGVVTAEGRIVERALVPTPMGDEPATISAMRGVIGELRERHPSVEAIGVGAAGLVDWPSGRIRWAPHNAYRQLPLRRLLYEATGLPTVVDNDANAAAWAEARYGAGAGSDHMVLLTVGTGIGGGLVLDGHVYRGSSGLGAEVGHMTVDPGGELCDCGNVGCLEAMASGSALGRAGRRAARADPGGLLAQLAGHPEKVTGELVFQAAQQGDATAIELFERLGFWLGVGIAALVTVFDPELVVIGGGLVHTGDLLLKPARASMERYTFGLAYRDLPPVVPARLGSNAGMVGAATLALRAGG